jgi:hypothetical protein
VIPHPWRTNNGKEQLGALGLQKGELLKQFPALPLRFLPTPLGIGHFIKQALRVLLGHLSSLARLRTLTLEKGDPSNKALYLLTSRD